MVRDTDEGVPLPMDGPLVGADYRPEEKGKRFFMAGGPWGLMYPLNMLPVECEEDDPNP